MNNIKSPLEGITHDRWKASTSSVMNICSYPSAVNPVDIVAYQMANILRMYRISSVMLRSNSGILARMVCVVAG